MPTRQNTHPAETSARALKASRLIEAFHHLAAPCDEVSPTATDVYAMAVEADDDLWARVEALAGVRPASEVTRAVVVTILHDVAAADYTRGVYTRAGWDVEAEVASRRCGRRS